MPTKKPTPDSPDIAAAIKKVADELGPLYQLEMVADNLGDMVGALRTLADATALRVIADHGSREDQERVVDMLKGWFEGFG